MGWGDVRYCFAMAILVIIFIIIITSHRTQSGDVLLFYVSFSLLLVHLDQGPGELLPSLGVRLPSSVNFSHFKLLLRNHVADWNRT